MSEVTFSDPPTRGRGGIFVAGLEEFTFLPVPGTSATFAARVFSKIDASGDCWEWLGATNKGYGVIGRGGRGAGLEQAHRAVWLLLVGPLDSDIQIDHLCRNHGCCYPGHLDPVSAEINKARGFSPAVLHSRRKTCAYGHPLDGRTTSSRTGRAIRYCKTCARQKASARYVPAPKVSRTHCKSGQHEWAPENIYTDPKKGTQTCKACKIGRRQATREAAKKAA